MISITKQDKNNYLITGMILLISLLIPFVQYSFRRFDDNSIISWDWIFAIVNPANIAIILIPVLLLVLVSISVLKLSLPTRARSAFLFFACFISASLLWTMPEVKIDTARYFIQAKHLELYGINYFLREWGRAIPIWTDLPAIPFFQGIVFTLFGESRIFIQIFNAALFAMTAVFTSLIGKDLWNEDIGFYAGLLLLGMPYLLSQTPLMLVDVPTAFFLMLSLYLFIQAVDKGGAMRSAAAIAAAFFTILCKYSTWPMLSVLPLTTIIFAHRSDGTRRRLLILRSIGVFLPLLIAVVVFVSLEFRVVTEQIRLLIHFQKPAIDKWTESFTSTFLFQIHPIISIAALISLAVAVRKRDLRYLIIVLLPLPIFLLQIKRIRYALPVLPMVALMASYGLSVIRDQTHRKLIVACVVATSLVITIFAYLPFMDQWSAVNLKQAGSFLDKLDVDVVEVFTVPERRYPINPAVAVPILDLFTNKRIIFQYVPGVSTPDVEVHQSRFRFSWEYSNPGYYTAPDDTSGKRAVVLIAGRPHDKVPPELDDTLRGLHNLKLFTTFNPISQYITLVRIYW
jgi:4-amino-4-deoxy-L-arabinose transferase-like glycosyltransferase